MMTLNKYCKEVVSPIFLASFFVLAGCQHNKYAEAYFNRGIAYARLEENQQAIKDFDKAIELNPKLAQPYYNRAIAYLRLGDDRQAIEDYKSAARLGHKRAQDFLKAKGIGW